MKGELTNAARSELYEVNPFAKVFRPPTAPILKESNYLHTEWPQQLSF